VSPAWHVVIIGGGLIGMETADFLRERGVSVTVIEVLKRSPVALSSHGYMILSRLREAKSPLLFSTTVERIERDSVITRRDGVEQTLFPVDQVVVAVGMKSKDDLKKILEELGIRHFVIGDARSPRRIMEATEEGARAAWDL
jgi:pyruvate/2-oxoglutarate dehydrogenase complex dihydrolipoamide dehydrogenase (E3) component